MKVKIIAAGQSHTGVVPGFGVPQVPEAMPSTYSGWRPRCVLGATSVGGLQLPDANPTLANLYAPRAAWTDGVRVIAADTGNHRVLIWNSLPHKDGEPADVVLGQPSATSEGPAAGGRGPENGFHLPTGILVIDEQLVIADAWHHRILVWETVPTVDDTPPDWVIGQPDLSRVEPNRGAEPDLTSFYWPFGIAFIEGRFYIADTGNRRVLVWNDGLPLRGQPADLVLGQPSPTDREENRGGEVAADSFRWPHSIAAAGAGVVIADAGNHRLLRWDRPLEADGPADAVLGQLDFVSGAEFPYVSQEGRLRFPYAVATLDGQMAVADTANNRVLLYDSVEAAHDDRPIGVLGQPTLAANGENRWERVADDTMCWPYGLWWSRSFDRELLAIADSGNNRVVLWERQ